MNIQQTRGRINAYMADNQVVFRKLNAKLRMLVDELDEIAAERGVQRHMFKKDEVYQFYCECSDENCTQRIPIRFDIYEKLHVRDDTFTIVIGHEVFDIETVISRTSSYCVVQKFETPRQTSKMLHHTTLSN